MRTKPHRPTPLRCANSHFPARVLQWLFRCIIRRWRHDPVRARTLWSVHPVCNSHESPGHLWRKLHSSLHFLSPANILQIQELIWWPGGQLPNSRDHGMPTQWGPTRTCSRVVSEVARAAAMSARVPIWPPYCLIDRAEFSVLPYPIHPLPVFLRTFVHTHWHNTLVNFFFRISLFS